MRCAWWSPVKEPNNSIYSATSLLYEWFSQFHRCGIYSVLSRSPSIVMNCYAFVWQSHRRLKTARTWSGLSFSAPESLGNVCRIHSQQAFQLMYSACVFCVTLLSHPCGIVAYNILCLNLPWLCWLGVRKGIWPGKNLALASCRVFHDRCVGDST